MKNLQKVLALGLALVMLLGMFTIASAAETKKVASDFPDWASVENKDAVSLMVDLGVINGTQAGTYAPAETIDRASWAKMVFFVLTGETDAKVYESDYPVLKDISKNWAQGYIEYLYSIDCISGDNLGNYNPSQPISVVAAAKTMLTGLGYNSKIEGYEGDANWATNIMNKAKAEGLLKGISLKQNENISRDAAAQMVYNALSAQTVTAKFTLNFMTGERVPSGEYDKGVTLAEKAFDIEKLTAKVSGVTKGVATFADVKDVDGKAAVLPAGAEVKATLADEGKTVSIWVKTDRKTVVSTSVASGATNVLATITKGADLTKLTDKADKDNFVAEADDTVAVYGATATVTVANGKATVAGTDKTKIESRGNKVELIDNDDNGKIDTIKVTLYKLDVVTDDVTTKTDKDGNVTVNVPGVATKKPSDEISGYQGLVKDDVVLVSAAGGTTELLKAEKVTGKVTRLSKDNELTVNGTSYAVSQIADVDATMLTTWGKDFKNEYDFYLDVNGSIVKMVKVTDEVTTNVALVLESAWVPAQGGIGGASGYAQAKLLFTDGTTEIVKVVKVDSSEKDALQAVVENNKMLNGGETAAFVEASEDDGDWTLKTMASGTVKAIAKDSVIEAKITFDQTGKALKADTETVFIVAKGNEDDGYVYSVHTSYKNVPGMTVSEKSYAYTKESGAVDYVYLIAESFTGDAPEGYVYFKDAAASYTNADNNGVYEVIDAKGNETELTVKDGVIPATGFTAGFYEVKAVNDDGVVTALKSSTAATLKNVTASGKGVFSTDEPKSVSYDNSTVCVVVDLTSGGKFDSVGTFSPDSLDFATTGDDSNFTSVQALVVGDAEAVADYIYVVRTAK